MDLITALVAKPQIIQAGLHLNDVTETNAGISQPLKGQESVRSDRKQRAESHENGSADG